MCDKEVIWDMRILVLGIYHYYYQGNQSCDVTCKTQNMTPKQVQYDQTISEYDLKTDKYDLKIGKFYSKLLKI